MLDYRLGKELGQSYIQIAPPHHSIETKIKFFLKEGRAF